MTGATESIKFVVENFATIKFYTGCAKNMEGGLAIMFSGQHNGDFDKFWMFFADNLDL